MASASVPTTPTLVFTPQAVPHLHMNGYAYYMQNPPSSSGQLWYCLEYRNGNCPAKVSTSTPLYNLAVENDFRSLFKHFKHPRRDIPSFSTQCIWILYKYDFSTLQSPESIENRLVVKGEVSSILEMQELLGRNNMTDDDPEAIGRVQYCFFRKDITPDWRDGLNTQFGGKFILSFREPSEVTRESLYGCWRALLTCIMQGTFGTFTEHINGAKVYFCGNVYPTPSYISVWSSKDFLMPWESSLPTLGEMLRNLFEPLVNVQYLKRGQKLIFN